MRTLSASRSRASRATAVFLPLPPPRSTPMKVVNARIARPQACRRPEIRSSSVGARDANGGRMRRKIAILACVLGVGALAAACDESYGGYYGSDYYAGYPYAYPYPYDYPYAYPYTRFGVVVRPGFRGDERFGHERRPARERFER